MTSLVSKDVTFTWSHFVCKAVFMIVTVLGYWLEEWLLSHLYTGKYSKKEKRQKIKNWNEARLYSKKEELQQRQNIKWRKWSSVWKDSDSWCFQFIWSLSLLGFFKATPSLFFSFSQVWVILSKNPYIRKQLDQWAPVMQQGSNASYLLPQWEMDGREGGRGR